MMHDFLIYYFAKFVSFGTNQDDTNQECCKIFRNCVSKYLEKHVEYVKISIMLSSRSYHLTRHLLF